MEFKAILTLTGFAGMAVAMLAMIVQLCSEHDIHPFRELLIRFRRLPVGAKIFLVMFASVFIVHGSTKTNVPPGGVSGAGTNETWTGEGEMPTNPPPRLLAAGSLGRTEVEERMGLNARLDADGLNDGTAGFTEAQLAAGAVIVGVGTNETHDLSMPEGAHVVERWRLRGAAEERVALEGADGAMPPRIEGQRVAVDTFGRIRTSERVFTPLGIQLGIVPMANWAQIGAASLCWWMVTASNSTVVCWQNAMLNRDTNTPVSVMAEFFDNGKFEYRYDLASLGAAATNVLARIETADGVEGVALGVGVTSVRGHVLGPDDGWLEDKDNDGLTTYDEIFVYDTDPELPDTDGDGRPDGEEVWNGGDPLVGDVPDAEIVARIAAGVTNEVVEIVSGELKSTRLWDGFAIHDDPVTNVLYTRTFAIDRRRGWTSLFLSGRGEDWRCDGADCIGDWSLIGCAVDWEDDAGLSGSVTASPHNDTLYLPVATNATSVTVTLRAVGTTAGLSPVGAGRRASPKPMFLLEYSPRIEFPGGQEIFADDGNTYCVLTDPQNLSFGLDVSNRPCRAPAYEGEATEADFRMPSGPGVYRLPLSDMAEPDAHPLLLAAPRFSAGRNGDPPGGRYLVIVDPWVSYGYAHYGCWHDYPYDWGWYGYWCDCTPECGCGVDGHSAVNCYIDWSDGWECEAVVEVGGTEVWRGSAYHCVWVCDHDDDEESGSCPCGCDESCAHCSCAKSDGPSQGSIRFRIGLGVNSDGEKIGFAWFESDGPVRIAPQLFEVDSRPDVRVQTRNSSGAVHVTTYATDGRDLAISTVSDGVSIAVSRHGASLPLETWTVTNVSNLNSVVRLVKRDDAGSVLEDWTYSCTGRPGEWVWEVADNVDRTFVPDYGGVVEENGTNWVYGAEGRLERLAVFTNGEEIVVRTFGYDDGGRLVLVDDGTNGCVSIAYDEAGNISELTGPEGTLRAYWDGDGAMTNLDTSAWNGPVPNSRPLLMAARPGLLGAGSGGGMTPAGALGHFLDGTGTPMSMPFGDIDTGWLSPTDFGCVSAFIGSCHEPDAYEVSGDRVIATKGSQQYFLGHVTIHLEGLITYLGHCNWEFEGTMTALDDTYDFNAAMRGRVGETLTSIGRWLFTGNGNPFTISFSGSKTLTGSGHCNGR